ncbi:MarR family winged helix-turn-helix transcriptional regulator [Labrys okinawensis]|uniref:MarR family winged helix-turn-helix transcriptional regulator n=1 Tax=Labrys okinawensis TaxID=346911 RepID=UPI0039BD21D7
MVRERIFAPTLCFDASLQFWPIPPNRKVFETFDLHGRSFHNKSRLFSLAVESTRDGDLVASLESECAGREARVSFDYLAFRQYSDDMSSDDINEAKYRETADLGGGGRSEAEPAGPRPGLLARHRVPAHLARRFNQICVGVSAEILMPEGLRPIEYAVLAAIDDRPGFDQRKLAMALGIDATSVGQMVDRLSAMGLVDRTLDPADRRVRLLVPTLHGTSLRQRVRPVLLEAQTRILAPLEAAEQATLLELLARVVEGNDGYARPGSGRRNSKRKDGYMRPGGDGQGLSEP